MKAVCHSLFRVEKKEKRKDSCVLDLPFDFESPIAAFSPLVENTCHVCLSIVFFFFDNHRMISKCCYKILLLFGVEKMQCQAEWLARINLKNYQAPFTSLKMQFA
jgi:hypothetical protein